jgi:syntaxin 18
MRPKSAEKGEKNALAAWKGVTSLSDKERDEIEFQVKVMVKRCLGRIQELEKGEEGKFDAYNLVKQTNLIPFS